METIAEVIKRIAKKTKRVKQCEACRVYYDVNSKHDCKLSAAQLAEYSKLVNKKHFEY